MGTAEAPARTYHGLTGVQWRVWLSAAMSIFLDGYDLFIIAVAFPLIAQQMDIPPLLAGAVAASVVAGAAVGAATMEFALFNFSVNAGPNPGTYLHCAELFPSYMRGSGHGLAAASGKLGAMTGLFVLPIIQEISLPAALLTVAAVSALGMGLTIVLSRMLVMQAKPAVAVVPAGVEVASAEVRD